ncbi:MAG: 30S ribosomal protein S8 [Planctomycetota bacterium]|nr:30S ribosomal protein S8 [Planctomycetota bacterium]
MNMTDPVADMLTRIRNGGQAGHETVNVPGSTFKVAILKVLKEQGYISDYREFDTKTKKGAVLKWVKVYLKYNPDGSALIEEIVRESKPGCRKFRGHKNLPKVVDGLGTAILSTNKGIMCVNDCRKLKLGGEVIFRVW